MLPFAFSHKNELLLFWDSSPLTISVDAPIKAPQFPHRGRSRGVTNTVHTTTATAWHLFYFTIRFIWLLAFDFDCFFKVFPLVFPYGCSFSKSICVFFFDVLNSLKNKNQDFPGRKVVWWSIHVGKCWRLVEQGLRQVGGWGEGLVRGRRGLKEGHWEHPTASYIHQARAFPCGSVLDYFDEFQNFEFCIKSEEK